MSQVMPERPGRIPPVEELINVFEVGAIAQRKLDSVTYGEIAGSDRRAFDRMTFRPRLMVNTMGLDLSVELFGQKMFAPIIVGPVGRLKRFHAEGELAMARGAAAAKASIIISSDSSAPVNQIAGEAKSGAWYQAIPEADGAALRAKCDAAIAAGCRAVCLTLGLSATPTGWPMIDRMRNGLKAPLLLKGIMTAQEARAALDHGAQGLIVSNYRGPGATGLLSPIEALPPVVEAVAGRVPILIDGSIRRGSDVLKAIALGARSALVARPALWGLAAYGDAGVRHVIELIQTELARDMVSCGKVNLAAIDRGVVRIHSR